MCMFVADESNVRSITPHVHHIINKSNAHGDIYHGHHTSMQQSTLQHSCDYLQLQLQHVCTE